MTRGVTGYRAPAVVLAALSVVLLAAMTGCGLSGITAPKLQNAVATSFAHLYVLQQERLGHPRVTTQWVNARARCDKGGPATPDMGAGNTWRCIVTWHVAGAEVPARAIYRVEVRTTGRYIADGEGPRQVNGQQLLPIRGADQVINPLWQFDGVLDIT